MLRLHPVHHGSDQYYFETAKSTTNRPEGLVEADPYWLGAATSMLGLSGQASQQQVRALFRGVDPLTGEVLSEGHGRVKNVAFDLTLSTPKSVSLVHALASPDASARVKQAHDFAVAATVEYLEREAIVARRSTAGVEWELPVQGVVAAAFVHRTSRANDPHLHSHVLIANLVCGEDGRWTAFASRGLYASRLPARALYESHLRAELTKIGVEFGPMRRFFADISMIPRETVGAFSKRTTEIRDAMAAAGLRGLPAAERVAEDTRRPKDRDMPYDELQAVWRELGYKMGLSPSRIERAAGVGVVPRPPRAKAPEYAWGEAAAAPVDGTISRVSLLVARCTATPEGATIDRVEADVRDAVASGALIRDRSSEHGRLRDRERFTTPTQLAGMAEASERIGQLGSDSRVAMISYDESTGRVRALDEVAQLAAEGAARAGRVVGVAAGERAAGCFEATTGIETFGVRRAGMLEGRLAVDDVVVLADCGAMVEGELTSVMSLCQRAGARPVLFGAEASMDRSRLLATVRAGVERPEIGLPRAVPGPGTVDRAFGPRTAAGVVGDASAAWREGVERAHELAAAGREVLVVAPDWAVAAEAKSSAPAGVRVVEARRASDAVARRIDAGQPPPALVVIGGAAPLRMSEERLNRVERVHLVVMPEGGAGGLERLGRVAEAVRPFHLTQEIGAVSRDPAERQRWRDQATLIEKFRERQGLTAEPSAYGGSERGSDRDLDRRSERERDASLVRRRVAEQSPRVEPALEAALERHALGLERATPDLGLGR
ncbi:MAG: MobF family relaxase [Acidimicrobiales bacterium]